MTFELLPSSCAFLKVEATCTGCGRCVAACPLHALTLKTEHANGFGRKVVTVDKERCSGCGICIPTCRHRSIGLYFK